jgi:hypothetical protein
MQASTKRKGSLVCIGSGIKSVGHFTLESQGWIRKADLVLYCVADPATEIWIKKNAPDSFDLYTLYGNDKRRINTYRQMTGMMVDKARAGLNVCAVFYGHPGIFVLPTHEAISTLREEGIPAQMLAGVSALDCLFADIGVDPAHDGCQMVEATDLLLRQRPILSDGHVVIWQVGCIGDLGFRFSGYDNRNFALFIDYLLEFYTADQEVVHYVAAQFPVCASLVERLTIEALRSATITGISTLYIPPVRKKATVPEMAWKMGLKIKGQALPYEALAELRAAKAKAAAEADGQPARASNVRRVPVTPYLPSKPDSGLAEAIAILAQDPFILAEFRRDPDDACRSYFDLTAEEHAALVARNPGRIRTVMKDTALGRAVSVLDQLFATESEEREVAATTK